jgi:hypothetical protein
MKRLQIKIANLTLIIYLRTALDCGGGGVRDIVMVKVLHHKPEGRGLETR